MSTKVDIWSRQGNHIAYPGVVQQGDTCVFASIAGAMNYLFQSTISLQQLFNDWRNSGNGAATFGTVLPLAKRYISRPLTAIEYHDVENPLPSFAEIRNAIVGGGVVIVSVELASLQAGMPTRAGRYHMLSFFNVVGCQVQVWDTNNRIGFATLDELELLATKSGAFVPYDPLGVLIDHDRHHLLAITKS